MKKGKRIEVWNNNSLIEKIYYKDIDMLNKYIKVEKEYIKNKQELLHLKKELRRQRAKERLMVANG